MKATLVKLFPNKYDKSTLSNSSLSIRKVIFSVVILAISSKKLFTVVKNKLGLSLIGNNTGSLSKLFTFSQYSLFEQKTKAFGYSSIKIGDF